MTAVVGDLEEDTQLLSGIAAVQTGLSFGPGVDRGPPLCDSWCTA